MSELCVSCLSDAEGAPDYLFPYRSERRLSEGHVGVRFGHAIGGWLIVLDGKRVEKDCVEAITTKVGLGSVLLFSGAICIRCGQEAAIQYMAGTVELMCAVAS